MKPKIFHGKVTEKDELCILFYVHVTVHHNRFLCNKTN